MAHELEIIEGNASFFSVRELPWHRLGEVVPDDVTNVDDMLRLANLNWEATLQPLYVQGVAVPGRKAVTRTNPVTGKPEALGIVGERWRPIQPRESAEFAQGLVEAYDAGGIDLTDDHGALQSDEDLEHVRFETGGVIRERLNTGLGMRTFFTMRLPKQVVLDPNGAMDITDLYLLVTNGFDGRSGFSFAITPVRVVCRNTEQMALSAAKRTFTIHHSSSSGSRMQEAREALGITFKYLDDFQAQAQALIEQTITDQEFDKLVAGIFPTLEGDALVERTETMRWMANESPSIQNIKGTKWGAFNAVTEYLDWAKPMRGDDDNVSLRRAMRNTTGKYEATKTKAWNILTQDRRQRLTVAAS